MGDSSTDHDHHASHDHHDHNHDHHDHHAHDVASVGVAVLTISSSRTEKEDPAGDAMVSLLEAADHQVIERDLVSDDADAIQSRIDSYSDQDGVEAAITTGGTGVTPDDVTIEAVSPLLTKELPGFGELFRRLSYEEIGARVVGTRAMAGIFAEMPVFCLPGSENAVRLGTEEIIAGEISHLVGLAQRESDH